VAEKRFDQWVTGPAKRSPFLRFLDGHLRAVCDELPPKVGSRLFCVAKK